MPNEHTLILVKPDGVQRGLVGEVISRLERKGLQIAGLKMLTLTDEILREHYSHLREKPFFPEVCEFMSRGPVVAICAIGLDGVEVVRRLCGPTNSREASPGTIRGDLAMSMQANLIHASDSVQSAEAEIARFFRREELFPATPYLEPYLYSRGEQNIRNGAGL